YTKHEHRTLPAPSLLVAVRKVQVAHPGLVVPVVGLQEKGRGHVVEGVSGLGVVNLVVLEAAPGARAPTLGELIAHRAQDGGELRVVEGGEGARPRGSHDAA